MRSVIEESIIHPFHRQHAQIHIDKYTYLHPLINPTISNATNPITPVPIEMGTKGKKMSVTVVCGHPNAVTMRLAQIAPEAPVLGNIRAAVGAISVVLFTRVATILGKDIRTAIK